MEAPEEVMLDVNKVAEGNPFMFAMPEAVSPDNRVLAWMQDLNGGRRFSLHFRDLSSGKDLPETVENTSGSFAWGADSATFYYVTLDPAVRPDKVWRAKLGQTPLSPEMLHDEKDERFFADVSLTRSRQFVVMTLRSMKASEARVLRADDLSGQFRVVEPRVQGMEYSIEHQGDRFFILHNDGEKSLNFQLDAAPVDKPGRANWKNVIAHRDDTYLTGIEAFKDYLVIQQRRNGLPEIRVRRVSDGAEHTVEQKEASYSTSPAVNKEYDTTQFRFSYTSPVTPQSVFEYDLASKERKLLKEQPVLGGYDRSKYQVERIYAPAPDGEQVPVTVLMRRGTAKDGKAPALLTAYGSYGASSDASFNSAIFSLVDRGFVFALAHIRGGSEKGRSWYENGRLMHKKNTFTDFIAAAEFLVKEKYTSPQKLAIRGGSAGGMLMGAVVNMRPDLFAVCIADVPFVDVINTMLDDSLPLTVIEFEQWGNPKERAAFEYMRSYSPYDNVKKQAYPAILSMTGLHDSQVCYWEPTKWVAKLRENTTSGNPIVLKINMDAGHAGNSDRYKAIEDNAYRFAFILERMGMRE
jgi:oligopeptidase B